MIKIVANVKRQLQTYSWALGQTLPTIEGKLVSVEVNGRDLARLVETLEIPLCSTENTSLTWHGRHAGRILRTLREME